MLNMKKSVILILAFVLVNASLFLTSCSNDEATPGMLTLRVMSPNGAVAWEKVYLAGSADSLQSHLYLSEGVTNENGYIKFDTLAPGMYWYDTEHWEDYGAAIVYLNIDTRAILWVNSPAGGKK